MGPPVEEDEGRSDARRRVDASEPDEATSPASSVGRSGSPDASRGRCCWSAAIYFLFPKIVGVQGAFDRLGDATPGWSWSRSLQRACFASYVALFRGVVGGASSSLDWRESYQITMAGLAATLPVLGRRRGRGRAHLLGAAQGRHGAAPGGLPDGGLLVLLYAVYMLALVVFGILLRTGVLRGRARPG